MPHAEVSSTISRAWISDVFHLGLKLLCSVSHNSFLIHGENNVTLQYFIKVYRLARAIFKRLMLLFMCLCECMWVHVGTDRRPEEGVDSSEA